MAGYGFEITQEFRGKASMDAAENWVRANIQGLWAVEFLGMNSEIDEKTGETVAVFHARFKFGRSEDCQRFRDEVIAGKPPRIAQQTWASAPRTKAAALTRGLLGRLFG